MGYLEIGCVVLAFIIVTILLMIFMPRPKCYFDLDLCSELKNINNEINLDKVTEELNKVEVDKKTNIAMIYDNYKVEHDVSSMLTTYELLRTIPSVKRVFVAEIPTKWEAIHQKGSSRFTNDTLRCMLPISISGKHRTILWVDGENKFLEEGEWVIYDNSRESSLYNKHKRKKTKVLIIDIERPKNIPRGIADIAHGYVWYPLLNNLDMKYNDPSSINNTSINQKPNDQKNETNPITG